ncbi:Sec14p-like phosphatidylinositol transfer family protein [Striga asiatica]|uniref:Sec14p-like phosphatidylinositol transfer family protein n=1 Tax=Striga asiatica TaxID=4170 RepID=A0A5A7PAZ5_STRAF|nr:Sec14p-like phosphatidylinositol transfer family protein [Striga asiatica]
MQEEIFTDDDFSDPEVEEEEEEEVDDPEEQEHQGPDPDPIKRSRSKALLEFRFRVEEAIVGDYLFAKSPKRNLPRENASLWGIPLFPSAGHPGTDIVLTKFLKANRYKVHEAFTSLRKALTWRAEFWAHEKPGEDPLLRPETSGLWFSSGRDKEGRPLCYSIWGKESQNANLACAGGRYSQQYLRWRVMFVERGIRSLDFRPGEAHSIVQIIDLENSMKLAKKEVKMIYRKMISLLHNCYPGIVYKNLIINVPSWFMTFNAINLRLLTQKSRNKFIFVKPSKVTETLLKYATPENILVQYGGLRRENDTEFSTDDKVLEVNIRGSWIEYIQIPAGFTVTWDVTVVGYDVLYKEEFIPDDDCSYRILLQEKKMGESIRNSFHVREPGKILMTIINSSYTKKKAFYRYKTRPTVPMYVSSSNKLFVTPNPIFELL